MTVYKKHTQKTTCNYLINSSVNGCFIVYCFEDDISKSGGRDMEVYKRWLAGKVEGNFDKRQEYINAMNPQSSFKNNEPIIKLNIKR